MKVSAALAAVALALFSTASTAAKPVKTVNPMDPKAWEIGPITPTRNYSVNMPLTPSPHPDGWSFAFPEPNREAGHVHYVTFKHGSLSGKSRIIFRYRIEADPDVQFVPQEHQTAQATLTAYFQRRGDDWSGRGKYEFYRWWATFRYHVPISPGTHELDVGLDENWTSVMGASATSNPKAFRDAIRDAERVGFTFGGGGSAGHGVFATGRALFVLTGIEIVSSETDFGVRGTPNASD